MKLAAHYNKASIFVSVLVLLAGAIIYYFAINKLSGNQLDSELAEELGERVDYVNQHGTIPKKDYDEVLTVYKNIGKENYSTRFFDTVYYDTGKKENEKGRAIEATIKVNGENYLAIITESYESIENLMQIITLITLILMAILLTIIFIVNKYLLNGLWSPFYATLHKLNDFNVSDDHNFTFENNKVDEFNELNKSVQKMTAKVKSDYQHLKHFTENASHETLTPLAVITAKLDTLIQDETLKPEQFEQINDIYLAVNKLSRLNQSLLLLVKIENNLIDDAELLNFEELVEQKIRQFHELISDKKINVIANTTKIEILASKYLIDIMLNNLFSNAIRHNIIHGSINITLTGTSFIFTNTGFEKSLTPELLFDRFQKGHKSDGTGLGLTIVKNICNLYNWDINYCSADNVHTFNISFKAGLLKPAVFLNRAADQIIQVDLG